MNISDQTMVLSLLLGVVIGIIYIVKRGIEGYLDVKKIGLFISDFTFVAICAVLTFIVALAIDSGKLRFVQIGTEIIGALSVIFIFANRQNKNKKTKIINLNSKNELKNEKNKKKRKKV